MALDAAAKPVAYIAMRARAEAKAADVLPAIRELQANGAASLRAIAKRLNDAGIPTARGSDVWSSVQVGRLLDHAGRVSR